MQGRLSTEVRTTQNSQVCGGGPWQLWARAGDPGSADWEKGLFRQRLRPRWGRSEMVGAGVSLSTAQRALGTPRAEGG